VCLVAGEKSGEGVVGEGSGENSIISVCAEDVQDERMERKNRIGIVCFKETYN